MFRINEVYDEAVALTSVMDTNFVRLGQCLCKLQDGDPALVKKLVANSALGSRKAYYLIALSRRLRGLGIRRPRLEKIGWTKLQVIADRIERGNTEELLKLAEANSTRKLQALMREEKPPMHCVLLYFSPAQYRVFENAALEHGAKRRGRGLVHKERAVAKMARAALSAGTTRKDQR